MTASVDSTYGQLQHVVSLDPNASVVYSLRPMSRSNTRGTERPSEISVRCLFFARYAELVGSVELELVLPTGSTVEQALVHARKVIPGCDLIPEQPLVAVNQKHATTEIVLSDGDELAFLPPLAGG